MSDSTPFSLTQLPPEILHDIFHYLDVPGILRLRRVSRYLNEVSHSRDVWNDAYRTADFVLPPGPFLSQSAHDMENRLVRSFRVDRNLRQGSAAKKERQTLKLREIRYTGVDIDVSLVFGRFLIIAFMEEVRCYDLNLDAFDSNSCASIIYRPSGGILKGFRCVSAIDVDGHPFACAVLNETMGATVTQISIYFLNVGEQQEMTLDFLHQFEFRVFDIDSVNLGPRVIVIQGRGVDTNGSWRQHVFALDIHTHAEFTSARFMGSVWEETPGLPEWRTVEVFTSPAIISTSTHLILSESFYTQASGWTTSLQAFALSSPHTRPSLTTTSTVLQASPSHSGIVPGINTRDTVLLHDAVLDSTTKEILILIQVHTSEPSRSRISHSKYGVLRLKYASTSRDHDSEVGTITFQLLGSFGRFSQMPSLFPSLNGTGRVFYMPEPGIFSVLEYDLRTRGGSDEREAKVIEYPAILRFETSRTLSDYDPYSGRICLRSAMGRYNVIEILDLAV